MDKNAAKCKYPGQPEDEVTQRVFYKSMVMVTPILVASILLGIVALAGMGYGAAHPEIVVNGDISIISGSLLSFVSFIGLLLVCLFTFGALWIWRNNRILVTNEHIVDINQNTLFHRSVSTLTLSRIQDVSAEVDGPVQTLLQYGTIAVQTAGEKQNFRFDYVPDPYEAEQYILKVHKDYMAVHGEADGVQGVKQTGTSQQPATNPLEVQ